MDDLYLEQMVKRGNAQKDRMMRVLLIICGLIVISIPFVVSLAFSYLVTPVIVMAVALVVWIMWRRVSKEYEYIFINGNLDIDVIYGRSTRRHLVTFDCRLCRMIVPADDPKAKKEEEKKHGYLGKNVFEGKRGIPSAGGDAVFVCASCGMCAGK